MNYVVFDLEATCWENQPDKKSEIIEIGAVKLNEKLEEVDFFAKFIRPTINPILSEFCTKLTSITQREVDQAASFKEVLQEFEAWIGLFGERVVLGSWGFYDKKQLLLECSLKNYSGQISQRLKDHISIKHQFAEVKRVSPCGMRKALEILGLSLEGRHHRGIDDAKNIAKIFRQVFDELSFSDN